MDGSGSWVHLAYVYDAVGDPQAAIRDLSRALEAHDVDMLFIDAHPLLAELRHDPEVTPFRTWRH